MADTQAEPTTPAATKSRQPAYVSYSMFEVFLDWLGGMDPVPARIDRQLWSQKFAPASGAQLMVGLRSLGLLDGGAPTDTLVALAKATGDARKDGLRAVLRDAYGDDLVDNLADKSLDAVEEVLRALGTTDATHRRALPFFINAAKAAGIGMQADVSKRARKRRLGSGAKKAAKKAAKKRAPATRGRKRAARKAPAAPPAAAAPPPPPPPAPASARRRGSARPASRAEGLRRRRRHRGTAPGRRRLVGGEPRAVARRADGRGRPRGRPLRRLSATRRPWVPPD